jgi:ribosomal 50S subunit-associated protein YjgA (DUF615 family)
MGIHRDQIALERLVEELVAMPPQELEQLGLLAPREDALFGVRRVDGRRPGQAMRTSRLRRPPADHNRGPESIFPSIDRRSRRTKHQAPSAKH